MDTLESEKRNKLLFIGSLALIALAINYFVASINPRSSNLTPIRSQISWQQQNPTEATTRIANAEKLAAEEPNATQIAAATHAKFLDRYLNTSFVRNRGIKTVALAVACDGKVHHALDAALIQRFQGESVQILPSFFTSEFVSEGLFDSAFSGSKETFTKLELAKSLDALLLAREHVEYSKNADLENVIAATIQLDVTCFPVSSSPLVLVQTWTFVANGAGFKEPEARAMAEERLAKQIAKDTKMSLP